MAKTTVERFVERAIWGRLTPPPGLGCTCNTGSGGHDRGWSISLMKNKASLNNAPHGADLTRRHIRKIYAS
jgi:hypothetical protein